MKNLSKYQRKNMTEDEIAAYEAAMQAMQPETIHVHGGYIIIEQEEEDCWLIASYNNGHSSVDFRHVETREDCDDLIEDFTDELVELQSWEDEE
jgi:hypothetical protein